jgi:preprotein translocase subunit YajC
MANEPTLLMMQAAPAGPGGFTQFVVGLAPWLLIFIVFYVLMIRPQTKRMKEHQATLAALKKGDEVVTGGGIRGKVTKVSDDEVEVEIASNVRVRVVKSTITGVITHGAPVPANN